MVHEREAHLIESAHHQKEWRRKYWSAHATSLPRRNAQKLIVAIHRFEGARKIVSDFDATIAEHKALLYLIRGLR